MSAVTTWLRAAGVSDDYRDHYYFLSSIGRNSKKIASQLTVLVLRTLPLPARLELVIDDSPTRRYGPLVEGADVHRNPALGPDDPDRRPSHANRRKTLRAQILCNELSTITAIWLLPPAKYSAHPQPGRSSRLTDKTFPRSEKSAFIKPGPTMPACGRFLRKCSMSAGNNEDGTGALTLGYSARARINSTSF